MYEDSDQLYTKLVVQISGGKEYFPGAYCFLNIPTVSGLQWHPISIAGYTPASSTSKTAQVTFIIKSVNSPFSVKIDPNYSAITDTHTSWSEKVAQVCREKRVREISIEGYMDM